MQPRVNRSSSLAIISASLLSAAAAAAAVGTTLNAAPVAHSQPTQTQTQTQTSTATGNPQTPTTTSSSNNAADIRRAAHPLNPAERLIGRFIPNFNFTDLAGQSHKLSDYSNATATVIAFTSTSCPLSRKYLPTLADISKRYSNKPVAFILVNCVPSDQHTDMQNAAATLHPNAVYTADHDESLATLLNATSTTDVILLDAKRTVLYHGAVDDQYAVGSALNQPRNQFLINAIDAVLNHRRPEITATSAPGCKLEPDNTTAESTAANVTWHNRISRILQQHCLECHRSNGVAPFPLETLEHVNGHAAMIRQVVSDQTMPPWFAEPDQSTHRSWANDRSLASLDKQHLLHWLDHGRPEGNPEDAPLPRTFPSSWQFGEPDAVVQIPKPIRVKSTGVMGYQNILVEWEHDSDRWVQGYEIQPTDRSVVHHVLVNVSEPGDDPRSRGMDGVGGYWAAYVPGNTGHIYPAGFARKLPAKASIRFQIHYTPNGSETHDQLKLGLHFADQPPQFVVRTIPLAKTNLNIPPQNPHHTESFSRPAPVDIPVLAFMAHMHVRGKAFRFDLTTPDGSQQTLLNIPRYDFNWQLRYQPAQPLVIPKDSTVKVTAVYDNSSNNPANPNPDQTVRWGEQTHEEMLIGYVETYLPFGTDIPRNNRQSDQFNAIDADKNGFISLPELQTASKRFTKLKNLPQPLPQLFASADSNNDNQLSPAEFRTATNQLQRK
jgi:thiol-disulfide isomerase/thioredoxin